MAINDKLNRIKEIKEDIKQALIDKGVEVTDEDSFGSYADKITNIPQEGGGDPYYEELYNMRTSNGTNMAGLFARTTGDNLDLTKLDVSKCTKMGYMFSYCNVKDLDCSGWDVGSVTDMGCMFEQCTSNVNTTGWDTNKLTTANRIFNYFRGSIDISNWDMSNVTLITNGFDSANLTNINGISELKLPKVTSFDSLFSSAECDTLDLSSWNTGNITSMYSTFSNARIRKIDLSNWNTSKVTNMGYMFNAYGSYLEELIIPDWDMTNVTSKSNFFPSSSYTKNLRYIDLSRSNEYTINLFVTTYLPTRTETTYGDIAIPADSSQEVIDALIAKYWRPIGPSFNVESFQIISELDEVRPGQQTKIVYHSQVPWYSNLNNVEFISSDESIATVNENGEVSAYSLGNVEIYARLKDNPSAISNTINITVSETDSTPYVIKFKSNIDKTTGSYLNNREIKINGRTTVPMKNMDYNIYTNVYTYDVGKPITSIEFVYSNSYRTEITELLKFDFNGNNITDMENMFRWCEYLKSINGIEDWNTSNVTRMSYTFSECTSLESLDLSSWDTRNVNLSPGMFLNVPSTCQIYVGPSWTLTESKCNFKGTFIRINPEYYTEYSIDSSTATFNMRSKDSINSGAYLPELSNGYDAVLLTLNDGSITTDLNTEANQVSSIKIYYPEETSYVKFANTKVKEVNHLSGSNITDCTGMFTNCIYLEKADLTSLDSAKVTVDTTMFEGVRPEAEVTFNESWDIPESDMGRGELENNYITGFDVEYADGTEITESGNYFYIYPWEQGCNVSFGIRFEECTYPESDALYAWIPDEEYENYRNGSSNMIRLNVYQQIHGQSGSSTMVIYETNSQIEVRIPVTIASGGSTDLGPTITGFTVSPESLTFSDDNKTATIVITPTESDRHCTFTYGIGSTSQFDISVDYHEAPSTFYMDITATQLYKENRDVTLNVIEERSGISVEVPVTVESENIYVDPRSRITLHYNNPDGDYNGVWVSALEEGAEYGSSYEVYDEDDFGRYVTMWINRDVPVMLEISKFGEPFASGTFTFTGETELWTIQGDSTIYTEKPSLGDEGTPEEPNTPDPEPGPTPDPDEPQYEIITLVAHYYKPEGDYTNGAYLSIFTPDGSYVTGMDFPFVDDFGGYTPPIELDYNTASSIGFNIELSFQGELVASGYTGFYSEVNEIWFVHGESNFYGYNPNEIIPDEPQPEPEPNPDEPQPEPEPNPDEPQPEPAMD